MKNKIKNKFPDLTTNSQKSIALIVLAMIGIGLYMLLPPLIVLFQNIWLALIFGVPLLFLVFNYEIIWEYSKKLTWDLTKKLISSDPLWYMYRYLDYLETKTNNLEDSIRKVLGVRHFNARKVAELETEVGKYMSQLNQLEGGNTVSSDKEVAIKVIKTKIANTQKSIDRIAPIITMIDKQTEQLKEVLKYWKADNEILRTELDGKAREYKIMKELSIASDTASIWLGKNSEEMKIFKESIDQLEYSISNYTANVNMFEAELLPKLTTSGANFNYNVEEGEKIIERLRAERINN